MLRHHDLNGPLMSSRSSVVLPQFTIRVRILCTANRDWTVTVDYLHEIAYPFAEHPKLTGRCSRDVSTKEVVELSWYRLTPPLRTVNNNIQLYFTNLVVTTNRE